MSKGTVQVLLSCLFPLGKILGEKRAECQDRKKPASATVMWSAKAEILYRGKTMFYKLT